MTTHSGKAQAAAALDVINAAFAHRAPPSVLTDSKQLSDLEYEEVTSFQGMRWQDVTFAQVERCPDAVFWFAPEAFCYYLPGILAAGLSENRWDSNAYDSLIGSLDRSPDPDSWDDFFLPRWPLLTTEEIDAVAAWAGLAGGRPTRRARNENTYARVQAHAERPERPGSASSLDRQDESSGRPLEHRNWTGTRDSHSIRHGARHRFGTNFGVDVSPASCPSRPTDRSLSRVRTRYPTVFARFRLSVLDRFSLTELSKAASYWLQNTCPDTQVHNGVPYRETLIRSRVLLAAIDARFGIEVKAPPSVLTAAASPDNPSMGTALRSGPAAAELDSAGLESETPDVEASRRAAHPTRTGDPRRRPGHGHCLSPKPGAGQLPMVDSRPSRSPRPLDEPIVTDPADEMSMPLEAPQSTPKPRTNLGLRKLISLPGRRWRKLAEVRAQLEDARSARRLKLEQDLVRVAAARREADSAQAALRSQHSRRGRPSSSRQPGATRKPRSRYLRQSWRHKQPNSSQPPEATRRPRSPHGRPS